MKCDSMSKYGDNKNKFTVLFSLQKFNIYVKQSKRNNSDLLIQLWDKLVLELSKHLKKSNAACFCTPIVLKLLIIVQMWKQHEEGN